MLPCLFCCSLILSTSIGIVLTGLSEPSCISSIRGWPGVVAAGVPGAGVPGVAAGVGVAADGVAGVGVAAGAVALFFAGACRSKTDEPVPAPRVARMANVKDVTINNPAAMVVALESTVAAPRGPKAVWEPIPPNAPAKSAALPLCSNTTTTRKKQTMTWMMVSRISKTVWSSIQYKQADGSPQRTAAFGDAGT